MKTKTKAYRQHGTGTLYKRGNMWWGEIHFNGNRTRMSLGVPVHEDGIKSDTLRKRAEAAMASKTEHFRITDKIAYLEAQLAKLKGGLASAKTTESAQTIGRLFFAFEASPRRRDVSEARLDFYRKICKRLADFFGSETEPATLTATDADRFMADLAKGRRSKPIGNASFNLWRVALVNLWNVLKIGSANPWEGIVAKKADSVAHDILTEAEVKAVTAYAATQSDELKRLMIIGATTGMRVGDCANLDWSDIDLAAKMIRVKTEKTGVKVAVPILADLLAELSAIPKADRHGKVLPTIADSNYHLLTSRAFKRAGIVDNGHGKKTFHSFRHTAATRLIENGVPIEIVRSIFGHTNEAMTRHYTHIREEAIKTAFSRAGIK